MKTQDYTTTIEVNQTPEDVFRAVVNVRGWWSAGLSGNTASVNDEFVHQYQDVHYCKLRVTDATPGKKVEWLVLENHFSFTKDKTEWIGTKIIFDITRKGDKTQLKFTHAGLTPAYECFDVCSDAWGTYIRGELRSLIEKQL